MDILLNWLANTPDFAVPYALAALGLIISERSGVLTLGAEGLMLVGALVGVGAQLALGITGFSMIFAMLAAAVVALLFAMMVIALRVNQVIAGLALVFFCQGLTSFLGTILDWTNKALTGIGPTPLGPLADLPVIGRILFTQNMVVYLTIPIFIMVAIFLNRSTSGLRLRAVGENPQAADAAGLSVGWVRLGAIVAGAALMGMAGAYLSVYSTKLWVAGMTGGRGWIAVGLVIFARWSPWRALIGAVLFGCIEALIPQLAAAGIKLPQYFMLMTPYAVTLAVMIWVAVAGSGLHSEPGALGEAYVREERR
jgi:simple sugar transport system permease protein